MPMRHAGLRAAVCAGVAAVACAAGAWAGAGQADVSPWAVGDRLSTDDARALIARAAARPKAAWREPDAARIPAGPEGDQIREGIDLLRNTSVRVGRLAPDPTRRLNWNSLNCVNCHQAGPSGLPGTKPYTLPLVNAVNDYPKFDPKSGKVLSLEQRTIGMFGAAPVQISAETPELQAILAYLRWLARDAAPGAAMEGSGLPTLPAVGRPADPVRGHALYVAKCQACHGADVQGLKRPDYDAGGGYAVPPLAGDDAWDDAGHMAAVPLLARYIYGSMPLGAAWDRPALTPDEALDLAAYVNDDATPRRRNPNRMAMYPDPAQRPQGFAVPERHGGPQAPGYRLEKLGPFRDVNEHY